MLDHGCRWLEAPALLVEQIVELLVKALLTPPLPARPPVMTHVTASRGLGFWKIIAQHRWPTAA
jgi:hypothetical protein